MGEPISIAKPRFVAWLMSAKPGGVVTYAMGGIRKCPAIFTVRQAYNDGLIDISQRRESTGEISYLATMRKHPAKIDTSIGAGFQPFHLA